MSPWFFLQRFERRESDLQDEMVIKEISRYQSYLTQLMNYRKAYRSAAITKAAASSDTAQSGSSAQRKEMADLTEKTTR
jgi:hypothetical protein